MAFASYRVRLPKGLTAIPGSDGTVIVSSKGNPLFELVVPIVKESNGQKGGLDLVCLGDRMG